MLLCISWNPAFLFYFILNHVLDSLCVAVLLAVGKLDGPCCDFRLRYPSCRMRRLSCPVSTVPQAQCHVVVCVVECVRSSFKCVFSIFFLGFFFRVCVCLCLVCLCLVSLFVSLFRVCGHPLLCSFVCSCLFLDVCSVGFLVQDQVDFSLYSCPLHVLLAAMSLCFLPPLPPPRCSPSVSSPTACRSL